MARGATNRMELFPLKMLVERKTTVSRVFCHPCPPGEKCSLSFRYEYIRHVAPPWSTSPHRNDGTKAREMKFFLFSPFPRDFPVLSLARSRARLCNYQLRIPIFCGRTGVPLRCNELQATTGCLTVKDSQRVNLLQSQRESHRGETSIDHWDIGICNY